jgi:hypothetical protein
MGTRSTRPITWRLECLELTRVSYEDVFERTLGLRDLDILTPEGHAALAGHIQDLSVRLAQEPTPLGHLSRPAASSALGF